MSAVSCSTRYSASNAFPENAPDVLLKFLQDTYKTVPNKSGQDKMGRGRWGKSGSKAGKPLILTPLIQQNRLKEAREAAKVNPKYILLGMESYAGYLTVNKKYNANLWFWYFPVSGQRVEDTPWIIWLQGSLVLSSLLGLFTEIGPLRINDHNELEEMKYSWGQNHSLLFIDSPVGSGFSFTSDKQGYATNQTTVGENLYTALQQFLTMFPELRRAPLTIAGEGYAGKHVPSIGIQILRNRKKDQDKLINLQGLAIGNGFIDPKSLMRYSSFVREVGLVDDATADSVREMELNVTKALEDGDTEKALDYYNGLIMSITYKAHWQNLYSYVKQDDDIVGGVYFQYLQNTKVRRALHVGSTELEHPIINMDVYSKLKLDIMNSAKMWLEELLENYRVMLYNGHLDIAVPYHASVNTYNSLEFSGAEEYKIATRKPWYHDYQLAGYYKTAGNLTEVMVLGAGHHVPADKPAQALGLISAFARGLPVDHTEPAEVNSPRRQQLPTE